MSDPNPYAAPGWVEANGASNQLPAPQYILTARTPDGRLVTERVEAVSGDAAVEMFRKQGFTGIVLHTDDVAALLRFPKGAQKFVSPRDFVEGRTRHGYLEDVTFGLRMIHAYLALAATALADHASARRHYGLAEPRLHTLRSDDLLSRCQRAIPGGPLP